MLNIFICDDDKVHLEQVKKVIERFIVIENYNMKLIMATDKPNSIIEYLEKNPAVGLYFLDVKMDIENEGILLAEKIRKYDPRAFIVFISSYPEKALMTFKYKVEAMEFISKNDFAEVSSRIIECIVNAYEKYTAKTSEVHRVFTYKLYDQIITYDCSEIIYFETSTSATHKICIHLTNGLSEFYGTLNEIRKLLDNKFIRCHKSYIINCEHIKSVDINKRTVILSDNSICTVSRKYMKELKETLMDYSKK